MFLIVVLLIALLVLIVVTSGASFAIRYYRHRFEQDERKAAIIIGATFALQFPAMCVENVLPGRTGEVLATGLMVGICVVGGFAVWRILAKPRQGT